MTTYSVKQVAKTLGIGTSTINRWIRLNYLKAIREGSRTYSINKEDLKNFLANPPSYRGRGCRAKGLVALIDRDVLKAL
ncbi:MAG: excisionase family DNA-binding protein [Nostoc sp. NMS7]|uniref:excisionase family DNA-binding protein n=1 Tax=Nostoc sp. NMS7 TaxID=2815391 RepID=UPI0025E84584|nr:excisionase family DNA-binding protein [Nostoc sp. NMS7]MBN3949423.1 excisionase family DNA-binding protein [Nostoc sp. NMS7]